MKVLGLAACLLLTGCGSYGPVLVGIAGSALVDVNQDWITGQLPWMKINKAPIVMPASGATPAVR